MKGATAPGSVATGVLDLREVEAQDPVRAGAKASAIARALAAGLPALGGYVIPTDATRDVEAAISMSEAAWAELSEHGERLLVVRSSSAIEDLAGSSMAGRFRTVVGVSGWGEYQEAVRAVVASAAFVAETDGLVLDEVPIAVLVQPLVIPRVAGVLFGVDPVTGRSDRRVIAVVRGVPEQLVSGSESGTRYELDRRGRVRHVDLGPDRVRLSRRARRQLVRLADRSAQEFGGPQDMEWAIHDGAVLLLQSRPVTTEVVGRPEGPVYGPGPVAETFPDALTRLEADLWVEPFRRALGDVLAVVGRMSRRRLDAAPLVVVVGGRVAVLLEAFGRRDRGVGVGDRIRALRAAWRVGRLRLALLDLAEDELDRADRALLGVPAPAGLTNRQLVASLGRLTAALESLHGYEMLVGMVLDPQSARSAAQSVALRVLARARAEGIPDSEIPAQFPIVLALAPPSIGAPIRLPGVVAVPDWAPGPEDAASTAREALRLRVRWAQEASVRIVRELGARLADAGVLPTAGDIVHLTRAELEAVVRELAVPVVGCRAPQSDPLPAQFRLTAAGRPVAVRDSQRRAGVGAGGGVGVGRICDDPAHLEDGAVLVVRTLDTRLAPDLPRLGGLVTETGSVLAHLAILARELGVPTVVGLANATTRWPSGTLVRVDGMTGTVSQVDDDSWVGASAAVDR